MPKCFSIEWLDTVKSTNQIVRDRISTLDNLSVTACQFQTMGRGQGNHSWFSRRGMNLTFSILVKYSQNTVELGADDAILITCMTTLGILDYLKDKGVKARIKWPNDILVQDSKICGILIENQIQDTGFVYSIIGIGLNLNQTSWPKELLNPISLKELTGRSFDIKEELEILVEKICLRYKLLLSPQGRKDLQEEFGKYVFRLDAK